MIDEFVFQLRTLMETQNLNYNDFETNLKRAERNIWWLKEYEEKLKLYFQTHGYLPSEFEQNM